MYGYVGKVLWVDLSHNKTHVSELKLSMFQKYLGGLGVASKIMLEYTDAKVDPYSPDNLLIFMTGPVAGTIVPTGSRYVLVTKSPLTGYMAQSWSGSYFANQIKFSGYDGIVVRGKANKPVYLWIEDGKVEFRDATHLWGKSTYEVDDLVKEEVRNPDAGVACIGPAGERLVRFACIMNDKYSAAGRGGVGAVMGSKNLKAIAVYGTHDVEVANMDELLKVVSEAYDRIKRNDVTGKIFPKYGTLANVSPVNEAGVFPTRNYQNGYFEEIGKINENVVVEKYLFKNCACHSCPVGCQKRFIIYENGRPIITEGPEYETLWAFSANCGNSDMKTVIKANDLCNSYGLDTISTGGHSVCHGVL
jgi:aldehyde:ferredoxin oxidoreductase